MGVIVIGTVAEPSDQPGNDPGEDLQVLEAMWREKLGDVY
jgi:hypothetical protein